MSIQANAVASGTPNPDVKIDTRTSILKPKSWLVGGLDSLSQEPEIIIIGFWKAGIVKADGQ